jgi:hypothetical protein
LLECRQGQAFHLVGPDRGGIFQHLEQVPDSFKGNDPVYVIDPVLTEGNQRFIQVRFQAGDLFLCVQRVPGRQAAQGHLCQRLVLTGETGGCCQEKKNYPGQF